MQIEQFTKDLDNGVLISKGEWAKLVEAALIMESYLEWIVDSSSGNGPISNVARKALYKVKNI